MSDVKLSPTHEGGCSAARVRPLLSCKRRRLVQPGMLQNLNSKVCVCDLGEKCLLVGSLNNWACNVIFVLLFFFPSYKILNYKMTRISSWPPLPRPSSGTESVFPIPSV